MSDAQRIRAFLTKLPAVEETRRPRSGKLLYWVPEKALGGTTFCVLDVEGGGTTGRVVLSFRARPENYASLIDEHGFRPAPYAARFSWVAMTSWPAPASSDIEALLRDAYEYTLERLPKGVRRVVPPDAR